MCKCLKNTAAKLEKTLKAKIKIDNVYSFDNIGFENEFLVFNRSGIRLGLPFKITYHAKRKDGTKSKSETNKKVMMFMTYCPFCGEKYPDVK